jgi:hypothetical protein
MNFTNRREKITVVDFKRKVLLLNSESCGADPDLGYEILIQMLEALPDREDRPGAIILWNTAVKLIAPDSPLLLRFKKLEEKGVKILAGRLCAGEFCIADNIAVGEIASMDDLLDVILHNDIISL